MCVCILTHETIKNLPEVFMNLPEPAFRLLKGGYSGISGENNFITTCLPDVA
jgi:hypothetical protein